jgi:protein-disulfide isomerase
LAHFSPNLPLEKMFAGMYGYVAAVLLACLAVSVSGTANSMIPLQRTGYAYHRGNTSALTTVEFFIDLTCSACMDSWSTLNQVVETYKNQVHFMYRIFPLPYHQQGFIVSKASVVAYVFGDSHDSVFTFMDTAYANQAQIYNSATANMTYNEVVALVGTWATEATGVTLEEYNMGMNSGNQVGSQIEMNTRYMWKYVTIQGVFATPLFNIDGLKVGGLDTFDDWKAALDPLVV